MSQVFHRSANYWSRASIVGIILFLGFLAFAVVSISWSGYTTGQSVTVDQPVQFSHAHHVGSMGIDCRYCHTSVEKSAFAGFPPTETCMSCHSQIWTNSPLLEPVRKSYETGTPIRWTKVNKVPEFVFFNHSIHVNRGINCNTCHGAVNDMNITWKGNSFQMAWCLQCHRAPERYLHENEADTAAGLTPRQQVFNLYWKFQQDGVKHLDAHEQDLISGEDPVSFDKDEIAKGRKLVNKYGVKTQQLADCWICHR